MKTFIGDFNWHGERHVLYTCCNNRGKATTSLITQLAKKLERTRSSVAVYFIGSNRFKIEEVRTNGKNA